MLALLAMALLLAQAEETVAMEGIASYYTVASSSLLTASGERLDDTEMTCAMLKGEFGTYYRVTAENGKSIICRLNDRGPYVKDRIIDLSLASMRALDSKAGLLKVRIEKVSGPSADK